MCTDMPMQTRLRTRLRVQLHAPADVRHTQDAPTRRDMGDGMARPNGIGPTAAAERSAERPARSIKLGGGGGGGSRPVTDPPSLAADGYMVVKSVTVGGQVRSYGLCSYGHVVKVYVVMAMCLWSM